MNRLVDSLMINDHLPVEHDEILALPSQNDPIYNSKELSQLLQREPMDRLVMLSNKKTYKLDVRNISSLKI